MVLRTHHLFYVEIEKLIVSNPISHLGKVGSRTLPLRAFVIRRGLDFLVIVFRVTERLSVMSTGG